MASANMLTTEQILGERPQTTSEWFTTTAYIDTKHGKCYTKMVDDALASLIATAKAKGYDQSVEIGIRGDGMEKSYHIRRDGFTVRVIEAINPNVYDRYCLVVRMDLLAIKSENDCK